MEKENADGTPEKQGKTDNKTKPTPTPDTGRQEEKMEQNTGKMQTRSMDKEAKNQSNNASASGKGEVWSRKRFYVSFFLRNLISYDITPFGGHWICSIIEGG